MKTLTRALTLAAAVSLGGCAAATQAQLTPALTPTANHELLYGKATPVNVPRTVAAGPSNIARGVNARAQSAQNSMNGAVQSDAESAVVYSDEWWQREKESETRLKRSTSICRC